MFLKSLSQSTTLFESTAKAMQNHQQPILECQKQIKHESEIVMISGFLHFRRDFILLHSLSHKPLADQDYPTVRQ